MKEKAKIKGLPGHWLDDVIRHALANGADAAEIAHAVSESPRFIQALEMALTKEPTRDVSAVQAVRCAVINAMLASR